jgi:4-aminobutyrate aminotransferase-like enzyme
MALAQIDEITRLRLVTQSARLGRYLCAGLASMNQPRNTLVKSRGIGLLAGLELNETDGSPATDLTFRIVKNMLRRGFILLPDGEHANVITFSPPLIISKPQIRATLEAVNETLSEECG